MYVKEDNVYALFPFSHDSNCFAISQQQQQSESLSKTFAPHFPTLPASNGFSSTLLVFFGQRTLFPTISVCVSPPRSHERRKERHVNTRQIGHRTYFTCMSFQSRTLYLRTCATHHKSLGIKCLDTRHLPTKHLCTKCCFVTGIRDGRNNL